MNKFISSIQKDVKKIGLSRVIVAIVLLVVVSLKFAVDNSLESGIFLFVFVLVVIYCARLIFHYYGQLRNNIISLFRRK